MMEILASFNSSTYILQISAEMWRINKKTKHEAQLNYNDILLHFKVFDRGFQGTLEEMKKHPLADPTGTKRTTQKDLT